MIRTVTSQLVRGFLMGAADIVPGVSGGTVALVLGIYQRLVSAIRDGARALGTLAKADVRGFWERFKNLDWIFLVPLLVGVLLAIASLASVIETQLHDNPEEMAGLFFGLVAASALVAFRLLTERGPLEYGLMAAVGVGVFILLGFQSGPVDDPTPLMFLGAGALAICAMILPGISGSFILLMIGMYAAVLGAVDEREWLDLLLVAVGAVIGLALFSSVLGWVLDRAFNPVMAALIGLMLGSLRVLWPWPNGVGVVSREQDEVISGTGLEWPTADDWFVPTAIAAVAFVAVLVLSKLATSYTSSEPEPATHV